MSQPQVGAVTFTVLFDNYAHRPGLETEWGFACLVETEDSTVLFDTGSNGAILLRNMNVLDKDPAEIDVLVFSHEHSDHTGGLDTLLATGIKPTVYAPSAFSSLFKDAVRQHTNLVEIAEKPMEILPGMVSTGAISFSGGGQTFVEQALVVQTPAGWAVVTGCAHPGVVPLVRRAREAVGADVTLVMGGFHLADYSASRIEGIITDLREIGVRKAAPSHCSGNQTRQLFATAFGPASIQLGVGASFTLKP
jgi:7,8-dihydropterin-6-yl-methyl-4-(beta-D-ribofuranosyl)aminobenzene 5'-phosphate synthase